MSVFTIIQIGDIHYPDAENSELSVDRKDTAFPEAVTQTIGTTPLQGVFRALAQRMDQEPDALISFMGDFTTFGNDEGLADCLAYIRRLFPSEADAEELRSCQLLIGNHDIDRRKAPDTEQRFEDVNSHIKGVGFRPASIVVPDEIGRGGIHEAALRLFGINSCHGCGQIRFLGSILQKSAGEEIQKILSGDPSKEELNQVYEGIDTPAVAADTISELAERIGKLPETALPVVCAHHNLLPQRTPRLAPYAELINGGEIRATLAGLNRPLIYLHGHLHEDPIEVVRDPTNPQAAILSISAPIFREGFNEIRIAHNTDGVPLSCEVIKHRLEGQQMRKNAPILVPLWDGREGLQMASEASRELLGEIQPNTLHRRADFLGSDAIDEEVLDHALDELRWLGIIDVQNPNRPKLHWRFTRVI